MASIIVGAQAKHSCVADEALEVVVNLYQTDHYGVTSKGRAFHVEWDMLLRDGSCNQLNHKIVIKSGKIHRS